MRRRLAWLFAVPIMLAGLAVGHRIAWQIAVPDAHHRADELHRTGHTYAGRASLVLALGVALLAVALVLQARTSFRGRTVAAPSRAFALLPPLAFFVREYLERALHSHQLLPSLFVDPVFLIGLAVQIPFGIVVFLVARFLAELAVSIGRALSTRRACISRTRSTPDRPRTSDLVRIPVLAVGYGERGPPNCS